MKATVITIKGGVLQSIELVEDAPREGYIVIDWDNIEQGDNPVEEVGQALEVWDADGIRTFGEIKEELDQYLEDFYDTRRV